MKTVICKNCGLEFTGNYCPECGQNAHEHRINAKYILHDIPHSVFHVDKGFFHTLFMLFRKPGLMVQQYLEGKRARHFRPFAYVILMSTIATFLIKGLDWATQTLFLKYNPGGNFPEPEGFFSHYISVFIFIMVPIAALITWFCFINKKYNYWEHFVANTFIAAQLNVIVVLVKLAGLLIVLFTHKLANVDFNWFLYVFMFGFLYMYGSVYGFMMREYYIKKLWMLSIIIAIMNFFLAAVYFTGFHMAGIMKPW